ncbi:helix-turn-helix transcriptional regulator [Streptomyces californicus]|uniref:helix-turn-helix transcriptional regulator n=1 Tax=Streptomyces californicus TaxID=67351 RepID=UPI0037230EA5
MDKAIKKAFAELPELITVPQIASATGRSDSGVKHWIDTYDDFPGVVEVKDRFYLRLRRDVLTWLTEHPNLLDARRRGPQKLAERALSARPASEFLTVKETAEALGVSRESIQYYAASAKPEVSSDPFPPAVRRGTSSLRSWPAVRSWILRRDDPIPSSPLSWEELRTWLLAVYDLEKDDSAPGLDDRGLTYAQRDVLERMRVAVAQGHAVRDGWAEEVPGLNLDTAVASPIAARRLTPSQLAAELGISVGSIRGNERRYPAGCRDPFPPKDKHSARDVEEVRSWLSRSGSMPSGGV